MTKEDRVDIHHVKYDENTPKRAVFHAVKCGTDTVQKGGKEYLPKYPAEGEDDYNIRKKFSTVDRIVGEGVESLTGSVFEGEVDTSKVNPSIIPFLENIDNRGNHFNVFVRDAFEASFDGHSVILVDMPEATEQVKALRATYGAEADAMLNSRPYWTLYKANDVINWRYRVNEITHKQELELIVVKVVSTEPDGVFKTKDVTRYRVWMLEGYLVKWQTWLETKKPTVNNVGGEMTLEKEGYLPVTAIPAAIIGELDAEPKLLNESRMEVKAYQKESSFDQMEYLGLPALVLIGRDKADHGKPLAYGPSVVVDVPIEGDAKYVSPDAAHHLSFKDTILGIKKKIQGSLDTIKSDAMPQGEAETATQVVSDDRKSQARLIVWAEQLKDAVELALGFTAEFMGLGRDKGGEIVLNTAWAIAEQKALEAKKTQDDADKANIAKTKAEAAAKSNG
jgi:hypothetical protein